MAAFASQDSHRPSAPSAEPDAQPEADTAAHLPSPSILSWRGGLEGRAVSGTCLPGPAVSAAGRRRALVAYRHAATAQGGPDDVEWGSTGVVCVWALGSGGTPEEDRPENVLVCEGAPSCVCWGDTEVRDCATRRAASVS